MSPEHAKARYEVFAPRMHGAAVERQQLGTDVQQAMVRDELEVHYQPLVRLPPARSSASKHWCAGTTHPGRGPR